jgi:hypothetical protein
VVRYLDDRAGRGFNAIIVSLIEHKFATNAPATRAGVQPSSRRETSGAPTRRFRPRPPRHRAGGRAGLPCGCVPPISDGWRR